MFNIIYKNQSPASLTAAGLSGAKQVTIMKIYIIFKCYKNGAVDVYAVYTDKAKAEAVVSLENANNSFPETYNFGLEAHSIID